MHQIGRQSQNQCNGSDRTRIERLTEIIHKNAIHCSQQPWNTWVNDLHNKRQGQSRSTQSEDDSIACHRVFAEVISQANRWNYQQVQHVRTQSQTNHEGDKYQPTISTYIIGIFPPTQHSPEGQCSKERTHCVYLRFNGAEPETINKCIG